LPYIADRSLKLLLSHRQPPRDKRVESNHTRGRNPGSADESAPGCLHVRPRPG
jgi:hypothetical protein